MTTLVLTLAAYYVITLLVGLIKTRQLTAGEFIVEPNSIGFLPTAISLVGTVVGGGMFLGVAQLGFESSMSAFALGVAYLVGSIIFGLLAPAIRRYATERGIRTLFGVFETIYGKDTSRFSVPSMFAVCTLIVFFLMLAVQFIGIGSFFSFYSGLHFPIAIVAGSAIAAVISTLVYSFVGGFKKDVFTDIVQVAFIIIGLVPVVLGLLDHGMEEKLRALPSDAFSIGMDQAIFFVGSLLFVAPTFLVRFDLWQRAIAAKSDASARAAFWTSGISSFLFFLIFGVIGLFARADGFPESEFLGLEVIGRVVPEGFLGFALASFFAAIMSSADTFLGVGGLGLAKCTVYRNQELESARSEEVSISKLRSLALIVGVVAGIFAFVIRDIVDLFASAFGILMVFLPALIGGLVRKKKTPGIREAKWSVILGLLAVVPLIFVIPTEAFLPGIVISTVTYLLLARKSRPSTTVEASPPV